VIHFKMSLIWPDLFRALREFSGSCRQITTECTENTENTRNRKGIVSDVGGTPYAPDLLDSN